MATAAAPAPPAAAYTKQMEARWAAREPRGAARRGDRARNRDASSPRDATRFASRHPLANRDARPRRSSGPDASARKLLAGVKPQVRGTARALGTAGARVGAQRAPRAAARR